MGDRVSVRVCERENGSKERWVFFVFLLFSVWFAY